MTVSTSTEVRAARWAIVASLTGDGLPIPSEICLRDGVSLMFYRLADARPWVGAMGLACEGEPRSQESGSAVSWFCGEYRGIPADVWVLEPAEFIGVPVEPGSEAIVTEEPLRTLTAPERDAEAAVTAGRIAQVDEYALMSEQDMREAFGDASVQDDIDALINVAVSVGLVVDDERDELDCGDRS